jgi:DNA modification methylase
MLSTYLIYEEPAMAAIEHLKPDSIDCIFTSPDPPQSDAQLASLVQFFKKAQDYIKDTGVVFVQISDFHDKNGNLGGVPGYFALAMKNEGWTYRNELYWHKLNDVKQEDIMRYKRDVETVLMFTADKNHYFNDRLGLHGTSLISCPPERVRKTEFASGFPRLLIKKCIMPATKPGDIILDPFSGTATTGLVALELGRHYIGFETKKGYKELAEKRLSHFGIKEIEDDVLPPSMSTN